MLTIWRYGLVGTMVLTTALVIAPAAAFAAPPASFAAAADSYVDSSAPSSNFGSKLYLITDNSPVRTGYLRFNVQGVPEFGSATLELYAEGSHSSGFTVYSVADTTWGESTITAANAPPVGAALDSSGPVSAGTWVSLDVAAAVTGNGSVSFAVATTSSTSLKLTSDEGSSGHRPRLLVSGPPIDPSPFEIAPTGGGQYTATSTSAGTTYTGSLKSVGERAVADLEKFGGGTVKFTAGTFDFGSEYFKFYDIHDVIFEGAGMGATVVRNSNSTSSDTEPFNFSGTDHVTIRDLTVSAGGTARTTSDAIDFDKGNNSTVERVKVDAARGRAIVFDGKNDHWTADGNTILGCVIDGTNSHGIELLASQHNRIEGCTITNTGGTGIQLNKSSTVADQPNKKSSDNTITGNSIDQSGRDGIAINGGDRNSITGNTVTNSADDITGRDGIRIGSTDSIPCDDNVISDNVSGNTPTEPPSPSTQRYGVYIATSLCARTVLGPGNSLSGNLLAPYKNSGTGTIILQ
jgi:parallel beta-helix repeat protein